MLQVRPQTSGEYVAALESFWGETTKEDVLARVAAAAAYKAGAPPTSLQAGFLARAKLDEEMEIRCETPLSNQLRAQARQVSSPICDVTFRFDPPAGALTYQRDARWIEFPEPEALPSEAEQCARDGVPQFAAGPIESRRVTPAGPVRDNEQAVWVAWLASRAPIAADHVSQVSALVFLSAYRSHWAVERCLGPAFRATRLSLSNFGLWIHRWVPWNGFWLVTTRTEIGVEGRCFSRREIHSRDGRLVASAVWEMSASPMRSETNATQ